MSCCTVCRHLQYWVPCQYNWRNHNHRMEKYIFNFLDRQKTCKYFYFEKIQSIWALGHSWLSLIIDKSIISKIFRDQDHLIDLMTWTHHSGPTLAGSRTRILYWYWWFESPNKPSENNLQSSDAQIYRQHWTRSIILNAYWDFYSQSSLHWKALDLVLWVFVHILYKHQYQF